MTKMRTRFNVFSSLEASFLAVQRKIRKLRQGSVIRSLLYAISTEFERIYNEIDVTKENLYVDTARGANLDALIEGFFQLKRKPATRAVGYVVLELTKSLTVEDLDTLAFSFSYFDQSDGTLDTNFRNTVKLTHQDQDRVMHYFICQPLSFDVDYNHFILNPLTNEQPIMSAYREYLQQYIAATGKPIKRLILPVVAEDLGKLRNLQSEELESIVNIGVPAIVQNLYYVKDETHRTTADVDHVLTHPSGAVDDSNVTQGIKVLGDFSYIYGGEDHETDDMYRKRFYLYLDSFSRGTLASLEFAVKTFIANVKVKAIESGVAGYVTVFVDSPQVMSKNLLSKVNEIVKGYRSAGVLVNLRPTKVEYINILTDLDTKSLDSATERARDVLSSFVDNKDLEETLTYTDIHETLDIQEIRKTDNVYYGYFLTPELMRFVKGSIDSAYSHVIDNYNPEEISYIDLLNTVVDGDIKLFELGNEELRYPLVQLVRAIKSTEPGVVQDSPELQRIVNVIHDYCGDTNRASVCLESLHDRLSTEEEEEEFIIRIKHVENLVGKWYSNYFKIKFMTIPPIMGKNFEISDELINRFVLNDIRNLSYDDLVEADLVDFSKLRVAKNFRVNEKLYKLNNLVGTRKIER